MLTALALALAVSGPTEVIVYELEVDGFSDRQRELVEFSIAAEINKRDGLRATGIEEARKRSGFQEEIGCDPRDCLAKLVDALGSDWVVTGRVTRLGDTTAVALRVVDLRERAVIMSATRQLTMSQGEGVLAVVGPMVEEMFAAHPVRSGASSGVTMDLQERWEPAPLSPVAFYTGLAATVVTAAAGTAFGIRALQKRNEFDDAVENTSASNPANGEELSAIEDSFRSARNTSNLFFAATAVSAITTTTLFFFTDFGDDPVLTITPTQGGVAAAATLRF